MSTIASKPYPTRDLAEHVAAQLVQKGIAARNITIRDETPAVGLNLGAGVPIEAIEAVISEHEAEATEGGYLVEVETGGDVLNETVARETFGYVA